MTYTNRQYNNTRQCAGCGLLKPDAWTRPLCRNCLDRRPPRRTTRTTDTQGPARD